MVCILQQPKFSPLVAPRDWSHQWDGQQPPLKGTLAFCTMLVGVRRKARWQPRTLDSMPPIVHVLGACVLAWSRSRAAVENDAAQFNANQLTKGKPATLWAAVGWGVVGHEETVRILNREGQQ